MTGRDFSANQSTTRRRADSCYFGDRTLTQGGPGEVFLICYHSLGQGAE